MKVGELQQFGVGGLAQVERPRPEPGPHQVVVRVGAVSLNYRDALVVAGTYFPDLPLPFVPLSDAAGHIESVGSGVTRFAVGDRVVTHGAVSLFALQWAVAAGAGAGAGRLPRYQLVTRQGVGSASA